MRERLRARILVDGHVKGASDDDKRTARKVLAGGAPPLSALGSGSDFTPFLQHLGIASVDIRFGGEDDDSGIYHSAYDTFEHYERFGDPGFSYGVALAQSIGRVMLRTANADLLPMRFSDFAEAVAQYVDELHKLADSMRSQTEEQHRLLTESAFTLAADPTEAHRPPDPAASVPFLNFAPLDNALARLKTSARDFDETCAAAGNDGLSLRDGQLVRVNGILRGQEQSLLTEKGLPGRGWYRHMVYAPGMYTGYGVKTLPGVREAMEERRWSEAEEYINIVASVLGAYSHRLDQAAAELKP